MIKLTKRGLYIPSKTYKDWFVRVPTVKNRRNGTVGLTIVEHLDLAEKIGILYIDMSKRSYVAVPKECLIDLGKRDYNGVKDSIVVYDISGAVEQHNLKWTPIPTEEAKAQKSDVAKGVLGKFGL